jgi:hypothetical protein
MMLNHFWSFITLMNDPFDDAQPLLVVHDLDEPTFLTMLNHFWSFMTLMNDLFDDAQPLLVVHDLDERPF